MELTGTVAIVTGGATGIGRAVCQGLARAGARAVVIDFPADGQAAQGAATAATLQALGCEGLPWRADVSRAAEVNTMVDETVRRFGRLDILVNCAGITRFIPHPDLAALTDEVWDSILGVNLKGTFACCRAAAPHLKRTHGAIINVASVAGMRAAGSSIVYAVSKAGVLQLTRSLALALAPEIRVNAVAPGLVATGWYRGHFGEEWATAQEEAAAAATPLGRVATADDVAHVVLGLLAADLVTGECLIVDGGRHVKYD
jgi:3-oxoacyl-[acyl-carrier protein] reductase